MIPELQIPALQTGLSHLIEANAGTGKTYAIANLFLRFVLEGHTVDRILVVTFTRAATDELRGRIRARLAQALERLRQGGGGATGDPWFDGLPGEYADQGAREQACLRLELALLSINEAPVHTIHGFCQQALADLAFHAGQPFDLEQADDRRLQELLLHDWWRARTYELDEPALSALLERVGGIEAIRERIDPLLKPHPPRLVPPPPQRAKLQEMEQRAHRIQRRLADLWQEHLDQARSLLLESDKLARTQKNFQKPEDLEPLLDEITTRLQRQPEIPLPRNLLLRIATRGIQIQPRHAPCDDFACEPFATADELLALRDELEHLQRVFELAAARDFVEAGLERIKAERGELSFDDMVRRLHRALHPAGEEAGGDLGRLLARRFPVVMVDEFQDTDPLQYGIFRAIHAAAEGPHTLIMIGDPKQAIYGFRGGDIFAYLAAAAEADQRWALATNWRSTPGMIAAVNRIFAGPCPFAWSGIDYHPSHAPDEARRRAKEIAGAADTPAPLIVHRLPYKEENGKPKPFNSEELHALVHEAVARRIRWLLQDSGLSYDGRPLQEGDICVLVRTRQQGADLRQALRKQGIRAVSAGDTGLWQTPEAGGLRWLLEAALAPDDRRLARQALTAPFLALNAEALRGIVDDPRRWGHWVGFLQQVHGLWRERGFMPAFQALLQGLGSGLGTGDGGPASWLERQGDPERCLTNLLHLGELLQQAAREQGDAERLLAWMREQTETAGEDEEQLLRLESDEDLVKIATIHASKGLQYPVVFVPYLWSCRLTRRGAPLKWHEQEDGTAVLCYRPWPDGDPLPEYRADRERLAEDLRLAYVALTRSIARCELYFGPAGQSEGRTAIDWLLSEQGHDFDQGPFKGGDIDPGLAAWDESPHIRVQPLEAEAGEGRAPPPRDRQTTEALVLGRLERSIRTDWRISSFSAMTREVHQATRIPPGPGEDFALAYPAGARVGSFLHALLEEVDPSRPLRAQIEAHVSALALRHGLPAEQDLDGLETWLGWILDTPLDGDFRLRSLKPGQALHELPFDFGTGHVDARTLDAWLLEHRPAGVDPDTVPALDFATFQGMVTGVIDLVFEHDGRYFVADYKSNLLGRRLEDYAPPRLGAEIAARRYDLQYLLYTLALHRHLRTRLPDYDYERHFGGVYYLFLRGMRPATGSGRGIWFHRPEPTLVDTLDRKLFAHAAAEAGT